MYFVLEPHECFNWVKPKTILNWLIFFFILRQGFTVTLYSCGESQNRHETRPHSRATGVLTWPFFISWGDTLWKHPPFQHQLLFYFVPVSLLLHSLWGKHKVAPYKALDKGNKEAIVSCFSRDQTEHILYSQGWGGISTNKYISYSLIHLRKLLADELTHACSLSSCEGSEVQGHHSLCSRFLASPGSMTLCTIKPKEQERCRKEKREEMRERRKKGMKEREGKEGKENIKLLNVSCNCIILC